MTIEIILFPQSTEHLGEIIPIIERTGRGIIRHRITKRRHHTHRKPLTFQEKARRQEDFEWRKVWRHYVYGRIDLKTAKTELKRLKVKE